ncbi:MAG: hypothetical protein A2161_03535 [Candidatus Schekmanbacteria bacterium RBG_13_48_7]|uniref:Glycosyl transferase family 1 domain-containing protein n=1 Tax=Candidatus Schekmanbacteria bacterium RBG_13_48_7 TaxID=1817878 RepID=A0A1F7S7R6_9BACT|nr:MAG: hypothetical protein A2161_03535 [Candidatus Schekmanbacteria bacterium RBG_13_48_7]
MKIAVNSLYYREPPTGISRYVYQLMNWLCRIDSKNEYLFFIAEKYSKKFAGLPISSINVSDRFSMLRMFREPWILGNLIKKHKIDLFHSPHFVLPATVSCLKVITFHDTAAFEFPEFFPLIKRSFWKWTVPCALQRTDHIIADSYAIQKKIQALFPRYIKPVSVVPLGIEPEIPEDKLPLYSGKFNFAAPYILFVGIISPRKNLLRLIRAYKQLIEQYNLPHHLVLAGGHGWWENVYYREVCRYIERHNLTGKVVLPGIISDQELRALYKNADMLIQPSVGEGFGMPVLEAMAAGLSVAAADDSSLPELIGGAGVLFDPYSETSMVQAMVELLQNKNLRDSLIQKGLNRAQQYTCENTARKTVEVYNSVLEESINR